MSNLPRPSPVSTFTDLDAPQADELPTPFRGPDYQPTAEDIEWATASNLDSFIPLQIDFPDWLAEKARQIALLQDERSQWLSGRVDELAKQAFFLGAKTPDEFMDRDEVMVGRNGSGRRNYRKPWVGLGGCDRRDRGFPPGHSPRDRRDPAAAPAHARTRRQEVCNECDSPLPPLRRCGPARCPQRSLRTLRVLARG